MPTVRDSIRGIRSQTIADSAKSPCVSEQNVDAAGRGEFAQPIEPVGDLLESGFPR